MDVIYGSLGHCLVISVLASVCDPLRKCVDAAAALKLGHFVTLGPFLSDAAASHTHKATFGHWGALKDNLKHMRAWVYAHTNTIFFIRRCKRKQKLNSVQFRNAAFEF